jgi:hypothetical protein
VLAVALLVATGAVSEGGAAHIPLAAHTESAFRVAVDGMVSRGSVRRLIVAARGSVSVTGARLGMVLEPTFTYGEQGVRSTEREIGSRLFLYAWPRARLFGFALGSAETSRLRRIDLRWQAGLGGGYWLTRGTRHTARITMAVLREQVDFTAFADRGNWRLTLRVKSAHHWARLRLEEEIWCQPSLSDRGNHRAHALVSMEAPLGERTALRISAENDYDAVVAPDRSRNNVRLTFGFAVGKGTPP